MAPLLDRKLQLVMRLEGASLLTAPPLIVRELYEKEEELTTTSQPSGNALVPLVIDTRNGPYLPAITCTATNQGHCIMSSGIHTGLGPSPTAIYTACEYTVCYTVWHEQCVT